MVDDEREARVTQKIQALARTFPALCFRDELLDPWDPLGLNLWACRGASHGEKIVIQFVLSVWNQYEEWECGKFDFFEACAVLDEENRHAIISWAKNPWWA